MKLSEWQTKVHEQLQSSAPWLREVRPDMAYGALAACTLLPLVAAVKSGNYSVYATLGQIVGDLGLALIASRVEGWHQSNEQAIAQELGATAINNAQWRTTLDQILNELHTPELTQAVLPAADWARLAALLKQEMQQVDSKLDLQLDLKLEGDVSGNVVAATIGPGAKNTAIGTDITQYNYDNVGKVVEHEENHYYAAPQSTEPDPAELRTAYLNRLYTQANKLALDGVDRSAAGGNSKMQLGAVYTALLTLTPDAPERWPGDEHFGYREERLSAVAQLDREAKLVLLGDPGSGKSTFVNFVTLCMAGEALGETVNLALLTAPLPTDEEAAPQEMAQGAGQEAGQGESQAEGQARAKNTTPQPWHHNGLLPVRIILRDFAAAGLPAMTDQATADHLWEFIVAQLESASLEAYLPHLQRELLEEGGLILLDGLDEVPDAERRRTQIKEAIEDFVAIYHRCRILVTSRTYAYQKQEWHLPGFSEAVLAPFTDGQIRRFVDRWYAHIAAMRSLNPKEAQGKAELLKRAIFTSNRLHELAERPLLLTLTASLHAWRGGSLPNRREELYRAAVDLLLDWWERQRVVRDATGTIRLIQPSLVEWLKADHVQVRALLSRLAFDAHSTQAELVGTADIAEQTLVYGLYELGKANPEVNDDKIIEYLRDRAGLLTPRGVKIYTFPHRTFQEYLAACHLTDTDEYPDNIAGLVRKEPNRWREVTLLAGAKAITGLKSSIWSLADALCYREPGDAEYGNADDWGALLTGSALVESADLTRLNERQQRTVAQVRQGLIHLLRAGSLPAIERANAGRTLAKLGDPRPEVTTLTAMQFCYIPAGPALIGSQKGDLPSADPFSYRDETPQHTNDITHGYWLARYPVTNAQFGLFVEAGGYRNADYWTEAAAQGDWQAGLFQNEAQPRTFTEPFGLANHPVVGISWYEALAYTRWLTAQLPAGWQAQLPSEIEWEKAARGGLQIPAAQIVLPFAQVTTAVPDPCPLIANPTPARRYAWGDAIDGEKLNYNATNIGSTSAVGLFPGGTSPYGAEELNGNGLEWTRSLWGSELMAAAFGYPYLANDGREERRADKSMRRVVRGGAFDYNDNGVRIAYRFRLDPCTRDYLVGMRVALLPPRTAGTSDQPNQKPTNGGPDESK